ncbi:MarR family winged helix-turn-helix transcriptional regulator [Nocardioides aquiterrae]|uniref:MarR family transcriptional regulator n=1 Tax=Nocardioides aquiterrae TaxID=203799 RepID=A0ABP4F3G8_9ACTN
MPLDVRWLDPDEQRAWRAWLDAHAHLSARLNRELQATSGLSLSDYDVLVHLTDVPDGRLRAFELARGLEWEKSRVSRQVARMAERGLVERAASPEDGRGAYVAITAAGRQAIENAAPAHVELVRQLVFDGLTTAQVRTLATVALSVLSRLDDAT